MPCPVPAMPPAGTPGPADVARVMVQFALECRRTGQGPRPGLDALADLLFHVHKGHEWKKDLHPRDKNGRFISKNLIQEAANGNEKVKKELEKRVDPADRGKLDAAIADQEGTVGFTARGLSRHEAKKRREATSANYRKALEIAEKGELTAEDVNELAVHLTDPKLTVGHLEHIAGRLGAGGRSKAALRANLMEHARAAVPGSRGSLTSPAMAPAVAGVPTGSGAGGWTGVSAGQGAGDGEDGVRADTGPYKVGDRLRPDQHPGDRSIVTDDSGGEYVVTNFRHGWAHVIPVGQPLTRDNRQRFSISGNTADMDSRPLYYTGRAMMDLPGGGRPPVQPAPAAAPGRPPNGPPSMGDVRELVSQRAAALAASKDAISKQQKTAKTRVENLARSQAELQAEIRRRHSLGHPPEGYAYLSDGYAKNARGIASATDRLVKLGDQLRAAPHSPTEAAWAQVAAELAAAHPGHFAIGKKLSPDGLREYAVPVPTAAPQPPEPGFTGVDATGHHWRDGVMVRKPADPPPLEEQLAAPGPSRASATSPAMAGVPTNSTPANLVNLLDAPGSRGYTSGVGSQSAAPASGGGAMDANKPGSAAGGKAKTPEPKSKKLPAYYKQGGWEVAVGDKIYTFPGVRSQAKAEREAVQQWVQSQAPPPVAADAPAGVDHRADPAGFLAAAADHPAASVGGGRVADLLRAGAAKVAAATGSNKKLWLQLTLKDAIKQTADVPGAPDHIRGLMRQVGITPTLTRTEVASVAAAVQAHGVGVSPDYERGEVHVRVSDPAAGNTILEPVTDPSEAGVKAAVDAARAQMASRRKETASRVRAEREVNRE